MTDTPLPSNDTALPDDEDRLPDAPGAARVLRQFRLVFNVIKTHFQQVEKKVGIAVHRYGPCM